jgi:hypothetical protein
MSKRIYPSVAASIRDLHCLTLDLVDLENEFAGAIEDIAAQDSENIRADAAAMKSAIQTLLNIIPDMKPNVPDIVRVVGSLCMGLTDQMEELKNVKDLQPFRNRIAAIVRDIEKVQTQIDQVNFEIDNFYK